MSNLIVMSFAGEDTAQQVAKKIAELEKQELISIEDAATAVRHMDGKVKVKQMLDTQRAGALGGAFWGALFGLIFFVPFLGMAVGAATGALFGKATDYGINDEFIKKVSDAVQPGYSALFLLVARAQADRVIDELKPFGGEIIHTSLSKDEEARLKEAFS